MLLSPESLSPPAVSVLLCTLGLFLSGAGLLLLVSFSPGLCMFFSLHPLTYLLPTVIPSHTLLLEQASLSLHLTGLSFSPLSALVPLPVYLASPLWASHSMLVLVSPLQVHLSGSSYRNMQFCISFISLHLNC